MKKQTPQEMWSTEFFQKHARMAIDYAKAEFESDLVTQFERHVSLCESPLEAAFSAWWVAMANIESWELAIVHQSEVLCAGDSFRLDLQVCPVSGRLYAGIPIEERPKIAIELDGHEFHERTKEQVTYRNRRDRALVGSGWTVLHFSGSEFHRDPGATVRAANQQCDLLFWKAWNSRTPARPTDAGDTVDEG